MKASAVDIVPDSERRGFIGALPPPLRPFASLMRLDRPIGTWLLYWPCAWSVALAGVGGRWDLFVWLALGAFAMRSAGCVYNDIVDRELDRKRRADSPAAAGERPGVAALGVAADRLAVPRRARRPAAAQPRRRAGRDCQHRAGRGLPVHEAHHLVAAGLARDRLLVGRAGRLAGGDAEPRPAGASAVARQHRLGDRLRHALRDPGYGGRRAGRGQIVGAAGSARSAPLGIAICYFASRCSFGPRRSGPCGREWLALAALLPAALHLANQALRAEPGDGDLALGLVPLEPSAAACSSFSPCWRSGFRRARRGAAHAISRRRPNHRRISWSSAASPPARPPPTRSTSASDRRACRSASASSRTSAARKARRSACGCSSAHRSATVASSDLSDEALGVLVERCLAMAREAPEDPFAGLAPDELLRAPPSTALDSDDWSEPDPAELRARALEAEARGARRRRGHQFERRRGERVGLDHRARDLGRIFRRLSRRAATAARRRSIAGEGATMQRDHAWHSARHLEDLEGAAEIGRRAGERAVARLNAVAPEARPISGDLRPARLGRRCSAISSGAITGSSIARKTSFLQDKLGAGRLRRAA